MEAREFGERLRQLREEAGLSQSQLAGKAGGNFTYLSKIESGAGDLEGLIRHKTEQKSWRESV